jgi:hypothetical protein
LTDGAVSTQRRTRCRCGAANCKGSLAEDLRVKGGQLCQLVGFCRLSQHRQLKQKFQVLARSLADQAELVGGSLCS